MFLCLSTEKKSKAEKEKAAVPSEGVSDLFARMSLKGSSHLESAVSSEKGLQTRTVLESDPEHCFSSTLTTASELPTKHSGIQSASDATLSSSRQQPGVPASSQAQSSLSVSVVIDELHLSSIDWDTSLGSFTAAPSPQPHHSRVDPQPKTQKSEAGTETKGRGSSDRLSECPLMERVRLRNTTKCSVSQDNEKKERKDPSDGSEQKYTSGLGYKPLSENPKVPPQSQSELGRIHAVAPDSYDKTFTATQQPKDPAPVQVQVQVQPSYRFVKPKHLNRPSNEPEQTSKANPSKKSVCGRRGSPGDDSEVENQPITKQQQQQQQNKPRAGVKPKLPIVQKTVLDPVETRHDSKTPAGQPHNTGLSRTNTLTLTCSTDDDDDDDDDETLICSPLPLAERLKLKFNK